jgi:hypothetical protein
MQQPASEQRRLLSTVMEKATWKQGALQTVLFEPFEILRRSNQESYRREREKAGESGSPVWTHLELLRPRSRRRSFR